MKSIPLARAIALLTPLLLLGGAYASQYVGGLHPCDMCWWQRYPHMAATPLALLAYAMKGRPCVSALFAGLAGLAVGISGLIGLFHAGVEYGWWEGLTTCATTMSHSDGQSMLDSIMAAKLVRCDVAPFTLFGISLAGFNAIFSLGGALLTILLVRKWSQA